MSECTFLNITAGFAFIVIGTGGTIILLYGLYCLGEDIYDELENFFGRWFK